MSALMVLAIFAVFLFGAASASAFWWLLAFRAMHPHDELSDLERYAIQAAKRAGGVE